MNKTEKLKHCAGCEQNFYNGNNPYGIKECWGLKNARMRTKKKVSKDQALVDIWTQPQPSVKVLSCYTQKGYIFIDRNRARGG